MSNALAKKPAAGVDNTARRVWDKEEFRKKAEENAKADKDETALDIKKRKRLERDPLHQGLIVQRSHLQQRDMQMDLAARLGKRQVVGMNMPLSQQAGYYCDVCDCTLKDSASYLDHINGKWHNRALGMTLRVEKSTVDQVKKKLEEVKDKKQRQQDEDYLPDGFDRRVAEAQQAEEREREERRLKKQEKKARQQQDTEEDELGGGGDPDMMALMGFGGFGGSKK